MKITGSTDRPQSKELRAPQKERITAEDVSQGTKPADPKSEEAGSGAGSKSRQEALEQVARKIHEVVKKTKDGELSRREIKKELAALKCQTQSGYKVLKLLLCRERGNMSSWQQQPPQEQQQQVGSSDGGAGGSSSSMLPEMPLSAADFLSLEEALNSGPFADLSLGDFLDQTASSSLDVVSSPPPSESNVLASGTLGSAFELQRQQQQQQQELMQQKSWPPSNLQTTSGGVQRQRGPRTSTRDPERRARFARTADVLARSGLLDVTMRTADLVRKNQQLATEMEKLKRDAEEFVRSVMANPENAHLRGTAQGPAVRGVGTVGCGDVYLGQDMEFHLVGEEATPALLGGEAEKKRKVEVLSEPMPFEDVENSTSLDPKRCKMGE